MRKIVVTGPECSGKSTLSANLARHYGVRWVPEMARPFLDALGRPYGQEDLKDIAALQLRTEDEQAQASPAGAPLLVCDTDLITVRIWSLEKYGICDPWIIRQTEQRPYHFWLLSKPDIPWEYDPQRENPFDRDRLFDVYEATLQALGKPYAIVGGGEQERLQQAVRKIDAALP